MPSGLDADDLPSDRGKTGKAPGSSAKSVFGSLKTGIPCATGYPERPFFVSDSGPLFQRTAELKFPRDRWRQMTHPKREMRLSSTRLALPPNFFLSTFTICCLRPVFRPASAPATPLRDLSRAHRSTQRPPHPRTTTCLLDREHEHLSTTNVRHGHPPP